LPARRYFDQSFKSHAPPDRQESFCRCATVAGSLSEFNGGGCDVKMRSAGEIKCLCVGAINWINDKPVWRI
jgi:hypothetical protein